MTVYLSLAALTIAAAGTGALWFSVRRLTKKVDWLAGGAGEFPGYASVHDQVVARVALLESKEKQWQPRIEAIEAISAASIHKTGFIRFNPFQDTGGDNSFILALLDGDNNGVVITSLYMREGIRLYAKAVERGIPRHPMSAEEKRVLEETMQNAKLKNKDAK